MGSLRRPIAFLAWIVGSLIVVPIVAALAGAPDWVSTAVAGALFVGPICYWLIRGGSAATVRDRRPTVVAFGLLSVVSIGAGLVLALSGPGWIAIAALYSGCVFVSVAVANQRSGSRPTRQR